jgi:hypothetical protein
MWIAANMDDEECESLWRVIYLSERRHLAMHGEWMLGDIFVAMKDGPVPLRTFTELMMGTGSRGSAGSHPVRQLWRMAMRFQEPSIKLLMAEIDLDCLEWALGEARRLGPEGLGPVVRGRAWERAGLDGELDPLEVAMEGNADAATLEQVLEWRGREAADGFECSMAG